jgi:caspase domain-containing protein
MRFPLKCAFAACALLAFALFALSSDSQRAAAGEHYRGHGGGGGGGWSGGVGVGVGVGTILLNEAIRRQQEKQQYKQHVTQPKGCPEGMTWSRKKRTCVNVKGPEIAKCEPPKIKTRKGCVYPQPETASCTWPEIKSGKGCACAGGYERKHGECVKEVVSCDWPKIRVGPGCMCAPGFVPYGSGCTKVVVVEPETREPPHVAPPQQVEEPQGPPPPPPPPQQAEEPKPKPQPVAQIDPPIRCLPQDLYDLLTEAYGKRPGVGPCPTACLPKPAFFSPAKLEEVATKAGISWCENCVQVGPYMPLASINKLEALAHLTICVSPDSCVYPGGAPAEPRTEIRTVFKNLPAGVKNEDNLAVVIGNQTYLSGLPTNQYGASDADAVTALLTEQLGYRKENIIDLRDASLADFERVFGSDENPGGEIAGRIDKKDPGDVFIYVASHGMVKEDDAEAVYLLPVNAKLEELDKTAYALQELYDNLGKTGARTTMLMLEANFAKNLDELIDPPNLPELEVEAMPATPVAGLAVFKASDRDQRTMQDPEYGIGLFTRYLIEGFAGRADEAPIGNGDKRIDTVELYVYTSDMVRTAARKSFGLEQKPMLSKIDNLVVGNLASR